MKWASNPVYIGPSRSISEVTTHVCRLKRLETQLIKDQVFSVQKSDDTMSYILGANGWVIAMIMIIKRSWNIPNIGPSYPHCMVYINYISIYIDLIDRNW